MRHRQCTWREILDGHAAIEGVSFSVSALQCNLAFKKLAINPIVMSAGELESGNAGEPAKLIRQRYREASDIIKKGKLCSLFINDLDAGAVSTKT